MQERCLLNECRCKNISITILEDGTWTPNKKVSAVTLLVSEGVMSDSVLELADEEYSFKFLITDCSLLC